MFLSMILFYLEVLIEEWEFLW